MSEYTAFRATKQGLYGLPVGNPDDQYVKVPQAVAAHLFMQQRQQVDELERTISTQQRVIAESKKTDTAKAEPETPQQMVNDALQKLAKLVPENVQLTVTQGTVMLSSAGQRYDLSQIDLNNIFGLIHTTNLLTSLRVSADPHTEVKEKIND